MGSHSILGGGSHATEEGERATVAANRDAMMLFYRTAKQALPPAHLLIMSDADVWMSALSACVQGCLREVPYEIDAAAFAYVLGSVLGAVVGAPTDEVARAFADGMAAAAQAMAKR